MPALWCHTAKRLAPNHAPIRVIAAKVPAASDVGGNPPRLITRHPSSRRSPARLIVKVHIGQRLAGVILHDEAGVHFLRNYVAVSPSLNRLRRSARHNRHHCAAPTFGFTSTHLMAPEPASTAYTPQPRGEANIAKTTPTAAAIASTTTRARTERVTAKSARPRWLRPGWGGR